VATVTFDNVSKRYANGAKAVSGLNLHVADGEFLALVGPSGCGKTTSLRMVAGLEDISSGAISIGDRVVNSVSPRDRDVAMVFQHYALYPHMTVEKNIGFGLKLHRVKNIAPRVAAVAKTLGLSDVLDRRPAQLSGGQRQRVAMGRAMVREPAVFLMDEPLSNLDAKLRTEMRAEVSRLQREVGVATLYVTHDQIEAMTMGDRVAVMDRGSLQQCDAPQALYDAPANVFVASFIGSPAMNIYRARLEQVNGIASLYIGAQALALPDDLLASSQGLRALMGREVTVGIRPEDLSISGTEAEAGTTLLATTDVLEALGSEKLLHFHIDAQTPDLAYHGDEDAPPKLALASLAGAPGIAKTSPRTTVGLGERVLLRVQVSNLHFFDVKTGITLR
jgi:multiple sugar transport system ATP-binding protein